MTSTYYTQIGAVLRLAREDLRLSLYDASQALFIRQHYLDALEVGELEKLPSPAYVKGYLQVYAAFLHLDKDEMIRRFELVENAVPERGYFFPQVFSKEKKPTNILVWGGFGLAFVVYIIWVIAAKPTAQNGMIIEPLPNREVQAMFFDVSCAIPQKTLYPPCYYKQNALLNPAKPKSIMELAK